MRKVHALPFPSKCHGYIFKNVLGRKGRWRKKEQKCHEVFQIYKLEDLHYSTIKFLKEYNQTNGC